MINDEITTISGILEDIKKGTKEGEISYEDNDIIILDNIRPLTAPDSIFVKMNVIACCKKGRIEATTLDGVISLGENEIFICRNNQVIEKIMVSPDLDCAIVCVTNNGLRSILGNYMQLWTKTVVVNKLNTIKLDELDIKFYNHFYELLEMSINAEKERFNSWYPFRREIVQQALKLGILGLCNRLALNAQDNLPIKASSNNEFVRFMDILQNTSVKHQTVDYYADKLCITPKYLTVLCKKYSNKTAQEWIREYTLNDISYYLRSTSLPIKEISARTGFPNTSFFGKYVKLHLGMPPKQYRDKEVTTE